MFYALRNKKYDAFKKDETHLALLLFDTIKCCDRYLTVEHLNKDEYEPVKVWLGDKEIRY